MIDNGFIFNFIKTITNKDDRGNAFSPKDFNLYLPKASLELYVTDYQKWESTQRVTDTLRRFISSDPVTVTAGSGNLPDNYKHAISANLTENNNFREIDIVTKKEFNARKSSKIVFPTLRNPILSIEGDKIELDPDHSPVNLNYLRLPVEPVFDYYYAGGVVITYLAPGIIHAATPTDPYSDGSTTGNHTSASIELEYDDDDKIKIISTILSYYGMSIPDAIVYQAAEQQKAKNDIIR